MVNKKNPKPRKVCHASLVKVGGKPCVQILIPLNNKARHGNLYNVCEESHVFKRAVFVEEESDILADVKVRLSCEMEVTPMEGDILDTVKKNRRTAVYVS